MNDGNCRNDVNNRISTVLAVTYWLSDMWFIAAWHGSACQGLRQATHMSVITWCRWVIYIWLWFLCAYDSCCWGCGTRRPLSNVYWPAATRCSRDWLSQSKLIGCQTVLDKLCNTQWQLSIALFLPDNLSHSRSSTPVMFWCWYWPVSPYAQHTLHTSHWLSNCLYLCCMQRGRGHNKSYSVWW